MNPPSNLEKRVAALEERASKLVDAFDPGTHQLASDTLDDARFMALYSIVQDLAEHEGITPESFLKHFGMRQKWWHDYYLRTAEDVNPALAAKIDIRPSNISDAEESYPPLFDDPDCSPTVPD